MNYSTHMCIFICFILTSNNTNKIKKNVITQKLNKKIRNVLKKKEINFSG